MNSVLNRVNTKMNNFKINIRDVPEHEFQDHFINYFSNVERNISDSIPLSNVSPNFHLHGNFPNTCFLSPCSSDEVYDIFMSLNKKKKLTVCMLSRDGSIPKFQPIFTSNVHMLHEITNPLPSALCSKNSQTNFYFYFPIFHTSLSD